MNRFDKFITIIFNNEGFLSDNKNDKGGVTKYGISKAAYPNLDIAHLTIEHAKEIYLTDYYLPMKIDRIENELLALHVFDFGVNAGITRAIKYLQKTAVVGADGVIGEKTLTAVNSQDLAQKFIETRKQYYKTIATGRNTVFLKGWLNRVDNTTKALK